jgi:hypothetical protein
MLKRATGFRAATHNDAQFAAAMATAAEPNHPEVAEELLEKWINTEKGSQVRRIVQEGGTADLGVTAVETDNDSENAPILHINEELGYKEIPGKLEFHRKLTYS